MKASSRTFLLATCSPGSRLKWKLRFASWLLVGSSYRRMYNILAHSRGQEQGNYESLFASPRRVGEVTRYSYYAIWHLGYNWLDCAVTEEACSQTTILIHSSTSGSGHERGPLLIVIRVLGKSCRVRQYGTVHQT